jgi:hypothetical protein
LERSRNKASCAGAAPTPLHLVTAITAPAEEVEHAVGHRREARTTRRGAGAGREQRRPGVRRRAEAVQVVEVACGGRQGAAALARAHSHTVAGAGGGCRRGLDTDEADRRVRLWYSG